MRSTIHPSIRNQQSCPSSSHVGQPTVLVEFVQVVLGMANLLYGYVALGEGSLLAIVALELDAMLLVDDGVGGDGRVVAANGQLARQHRANRFQPGRIWRATNLTCSEMRMVSPTWPVSSFHDPRNSSPRKGFKGFFSEPLPTVNPSSASPPMALASVVTLGRDSQLLVSRAVLLLQRRQEPLEHQKCAFLRIGLFGRRNEDFGMFGLSEC